MAQTRALRRTIIVALVCSAMLIGVAPGPAGAGHSEVTAVDGLSYNYYTNVSLFGGPSMLRGYGQVTCTAPNTPSGCVPTTQPGGVESSASPSVECPATGGTAILTDPNGARAVYGPATIFGGKWPEANNVAPPSGPLTSSIDCQFGAAGHVTASTGLTLMPPGSTWVTPSGATEAHPGGAGPGPFIADEVHSTCRANADGTSTASATIINGILETKYDTSTQLPIESEPIPQNPEPNYTREGTIDHVGDSYRIVFNEQTVNPDGSLTVVAAHMYLLGPTAVGDMVVGSSTCGPLTTAPGSHGAGAAADFDGDGDTDVSVFRPSSGAWYVTGLPTTFHGGSGDAAVPADYDGDGVTDIAVFRPANGGWYVRGNPTVYHGRTGDIPVPADYDGDGDADIAVFRPANGGWYIAGQATVYFGRNGDIPVPADYDGDGDADLTVFRPANGGWYTQGNATTYHGRNGDIPVPTDYDGDGDADLAVFRPANGGWYVAGQAPVYFGSNGDVPVPGHYAGDAGAEIGVFRPSNGGWYRSGQPTVFFGRSGDRPLPLPAAIYQAFFS